MVSVKLSVSIQRRGGVGGGVVDRVGAPCERFRLSHSLLLFGEPVADLGGLA